MSKEIKIDFDTFLSCVDYGLPKLDVDADRCTEFLFKNRGGKFDLPLPDKHTKSCLSGDR